MTRREADPVSTLGRRGLGGKAGGRAGQSLSPENTGLRGPGLFHLKGTSHCKFTQNHASRQNRQQACRCGGRRKQQHPEEIQKVPLRGETGLGTELGLVNRHTGETQFHSF